MVHIPDVEAFPSLRDFDPRLPAFTCIYPLISEGRNCANRVNQSDRSEASRIRVQVLNSVLTEDVTSCLRTLAELSCCKRVHRRSLKELGILDELCQKWGEDVNEPPSVSRPVKQEDGECEELAMTLGKKESPCSGPVESTPRYNLRSTARKSRTEQTCHKTETASLIPEFVPHVKGPSNTFVSVLLRPLAPASTSRAPRGMVKIGYTTGSVSGRLQSWQRCCGYEPQLVALADNVPHVRRAEQLVHYELVEHWRRELGCKHNPLCAGGHREWFEIDVDTVVRTIKRVARWMRMAKPYDEHGFMTLRWRNVICDMGKMGIKVTSDSLLKAYQDLPSPGGMYKVGTSQERVVPEVKSEHETMAAAEPETQMSDVEKDILSLTEAVRSILRSDQIVRLVDVLISDSPVSTTINHRLKTEQSVLPLSVLVS
ncbi:hypothetical protein LTR13_006743 [Exophiala sideris]|uniref:Bacteriophage T5 Orf172 DNA-binding domain-containing protein n=1 Tax=Exophiala sideris TaxID=1016849 RepID=A0ABR0J374_9EURO|nr:hypothetical protein LTR13_006743 [Exophiala sideris]KAK5055514.1 hypothetical protein LTR69_008347 [Exophiala sideris]